MNKGHVLSGFQCLKRLWMEINQSEDLPASDPATDFRLEMGRLVGEAAQSAFPGGQLVSGDDHDFEALVRQTKMLLSDPSVSAIFEGAFESDGIRIRTDILERAQDRQLRLIEVKSSTRAKDEHVPDLAVQLHVLKSLGIDVQSCELMHINNEYVYAGGEYDYDVLFTRANMDQGVQAFLTSIPELLRRINETLALPEAPNIAVGPHCRSRRDCPFIPLCHAGGPEHPIADLPRLSAELGERFDADGIEDIPSIPEGYGLKPNHERIRNCVISGEPFFDKAGIRSTIENWTFPLHFLDFESFSPALPLYRETRPYQQLPFQWSDHILTNDGQLAHREFLHAGQDDPRPDFIRTLIDVLEDKGSIVVYSGFEQTQLKALQEAFPDHHNEIQGIIERLSDLLPVIKTYTYHPEYHGSFSIKYVLPALVPDLSYDGLEVQDGSTASAVYFDLVQGNVPPDEEEKLRNALLRYCEMDTLAMVRLYQRLKEI